MSVVVGQDYAFAEKITWGFDIGMGDAFALVTRERLVLFPYRVELHENVRGKIRVTNTRIRVDGIHPLEAAIALLDSADTTVESMNQAVDRWLEQVPKGPICREFSTIAGIRIWTGWIRRSVAFAPPEGVSKIGNSISIRPKKEEMDGFVSLLEGHPLLEFIK